MVDIVSYNEVSDLNWDITELLAQYRNDLLRYIDLCDKKDTTGMHKRYALNTLEKKWVSLLGFNKSIIQADILEMSSPKIETTKSMTLKEALSGYVPANSWLIPNLLRTSGLYVLGGEPKVGKTVLTYLLMKAVTTTGKFLDLPVKTGKVLFIQKEEGKSLIQERLYLAGFGDLTEEASLVANFLDMIRIELDFDITSDLNKLTSLIMEYKPVLTIIDSLRAVSSNSIHSENSTEFARPLYALQRVFNSTDTCGLVIHHMNKNKKTSGEPNLVDLFSGTTAISAATDGLIGLLNTKGEDGRKAINLRTLPRQGTELNIVYRVEYQDGMWSLSKLSDTSPAKHQITGLILNFLGQNIGEFFTEKVILKEIGISPNEPKYNECLTYLETNQIITKIFKDKKFKYGLTEESNWVLNPIDLRSLVDPIILDANKLARCISKSEIRELVLKWGQEYTSQLMNYLLDNDIPKIHTLIKSYEFLIGSKVIYEGGIYEVVENLTETPTLNNVKYVIKKPEKNSRKITVREDELTQYYEPEPEETISDEEDERNTMDLFSDEPFDEVQKEVSYLIPADDPLQFIQEELQA